MPALTSEAKAYDQAYQQMKVSQAMKNELEAQKLQLDLQKAIQENQLLTPQGRASIAAENAIALEQMRQQRDGVDISKTPNVPGKSLIDMSKEEGMRLVNEKAAKAREAAVQNFLAGEKSILPSATVDIGGVKRTVLAPQAGQAMGDVYEQTYTSLVPKAAKAYMAEGYDSDTAYKMASADTRNLLLKERSSGNVTIMSSDMQTSYPIPYAKAEAMWRDPKTPPAQRSQLNKIFGEPEQPKAPSWIQTRLGR